jgi:hypothetical protein
MIDEHGNIFCDNPRCSPKGTGKRLGLTLNGVAIVMIPCPRCNYLNIIDTRLFDKHNEVCNNTLG